MRTLVKIFKALADSNRIRILKMLEVRPLCVCEITEVLNLAASTVSKHLSILRDADFIIDSKDGKWVNYCLNKEDTDPQVIELLKHIGEWLPDDELINNDRKNVNAVNRNKICGV